MWTSRQIKNLQMYFHLLWTQPYASMSLSNKVSQMLALTRLYQLLLHLRSRGCDDSGCYFFFIGWQIQKGVFPSLVFFLGFYMLLGCFLAWQRSSTLYWEPVRQFCSFRNVGLSCQMKNTPSCSSCFVKKKKKKSLRSFLGFFFVLFVWLVGFFKTEIK